jgi:hypothetical protein
MTPAARLARRCEHIAPRIEGRPRHLASDRSEAAQEAAPAPAPFLLNASDPVHIKDVRGQYKKTNVKTLVRSVTIRGSYSGTATT